MEFRLAKLDVQVCKFNLALFLRAILLLSPIILLFYQENGLTVKDLFFFQGIFYLTSILSEVPVGYLSDTIPRKNLLVLSFGIFLGITVIWLFCQGYFVILLGEILFGISKVMMDNAMSGYLYDYITEHKEKANMVRYYGYLNFYLALGTAIAALGGTYMYSHFGSKTILITEIFLIITSILLVLSLPSIRVVQEQKILVSERIKEFLKVAKEIYENVQIKYYIFYSGLLTSFSILFALSFQPLMQNAMFPIFLFGIVAFLNHGIRALSGVVAGRWLRNFDIKKMVIPLFFLYVLGFVCIFKILTLTSIKLILLLLFLICLIIGVQLLFTILHVSRLHKFVTIENRGNLMSINNFISRVMAATVLISSKLFIGKLDLQLFFLIAFAVFFVSCFYLMIRVYRIKD